MTSQKDQEGRDGDWRWLVLLLAALVVAAWAPASRFLLEVWANRSGGEAPGVAAWSDLDWRWRAAGDGGEGFYRAGRVQTNAPMASTPPALTRPTAVDPRLAIFTYRPIDLNRAEAEVLQTIRGIGPKLAGAIVRHRESNGPFRRVDELLLVDGIGPGRLAELCSRLTVGGEQGLE